MSFGLSPSDIIALIRIAHGVYSNYKISGDEFELITKSFESFEAMLGQVQETLERIQLDLTQRKRLRTITSDSLKLLEDCTDFRKKYSSLGTCAQRRRDRLQWDQKKAEKLEKRISLQTSSWSLYSSSLCLHTLHRKNPTSHEEASSSKFPPSALSHQGDIGWDDQRWSSETFEGSYNDKEPFKSVVRQPLNPEPLDCRELLGEDADDYPTSLSQSSTIKVTPSDAGRNAKPPGDFFHGLRKPEPLAFNPCKKKTRAGSESSAKAKTSSIKSSAESRRKSTPFGSSATSIGQQRSPFS